MSTQLYLIDGIFIITLSLACFRLIFLNDSKKRIISEQSKEIDLLKKDIYNILVNDAEIISKTK